MRVDNFDLLFAEGREFPPLPGLHSLFTLLPELRERVVALDLLAREKQDFLDGELHPVPLEEEDDQADRIDSRAKPCAVFCD